MITLHVHTFDATEILRVLTSIHQQGEQLMALSAAVLEKIAEIQTALSGIGTQLTAGVAGIQADIQALKDKISAGGMAEADILDALSNIATGVTAVGQQAQAVTDLDLANPEAPPAPDAKRR